MKFNSQLTFSGIVIVCVLLFFISCSSISILVPSPTLPLASIPTEAVSFQLNRDFTLTEILEQAESEGKLVFLDFYASWCLPCQMMDEEVFNQKDVFKYFNDHFISYKVDVEKKNGANLKLLFQADELPTLLFLDKNGRVIQRNTGGMSQTKLLNMAKLAREA